MVPPSGSSGCTIDAYVAWYAAVREKPFGAVDGSLCSFSTRTSRSHPSSFRFISPVSACVAYTSAAARHSRTNTSVRMPSINACVCQCNSAPIGAT